MGKRGPKGLSADELERRGSWKEPIRRKEEEKMEREKRLLIEGVLNQTFMGTFLAKPGPRFSQSDIDDAVNYFLKLGGEDFVRVFSEILRRELEGCLGVKIKSKYDLAKK